ncbi:MAG: serine/threonine-protein phosphatase [Lachnospiraceae bacterium]|nr:serine/threonine-protein phosphatase [Lachnospiraceae bacterium]
MNYLVAYNTDVGLRKHTNQDSLAVKIMDTEYGRIVLAIVCDGMGGLAHGELASKEVIRAYCDWFDHNLAEMVRNKELDLDQICRDWREIAIVENDRLGQYGAKRGINLGTTLSAILILQNQYIIVHVGDSRIYQLTEARVRQVTEDQSVVAREIVLGNLTPEQALKDPRRSILLQCIGASPMVEPAFFRGAVEPEMSFLICSDGFCHEISHEEMLERLGPQACGDAMTMKQNCMELTDLVKKRQETDNISMILLKTLA